MRYSSDILIVGAGITGCCLARELSRYNASVIVVDCAFDVAEGATKANSGLVHAGYDAVPGTKKAYYNVRGASLYPLLCETLGVPYRRCGAFVIAFTEEELRTLQELKSRGEENGVKRLSVLSREDTLRLEPALNPEVLGALDVPASAIISPYETAFALADDAALNGVSFLFGQEVRSVEYLSDQRSYAVRTGSDEFYCRVFVNCAGASGAEIHNLISPEKLTMVHRRGEYYLLDHSVVPPFSRTVFQCPSRLGKGVLVSPTVHGNVFLGPNAEDIDDPLDTSTTAEGLSFVLRAARKTWPAVSLKNNITNFSGVRAHLSTNDFLIGEVAGSPGAFEAVGIESPGLSSAPAIAADLCGMIVSRLNLSAKNDLVPCNPPPKAFRDMTPPEREEAIRTDPLYGNIVCRCEVVTEAEIRYAVRRPVGARTIDAVKRRTRAGMGRCQGGFCMPRVASIIAEEQGISLLEVTKNSNCDYLLSGTVESFLKGESGK